MAVVSFRAGGCSERARARKAPLRWFPTEALDCPSQETGREARIAAQPRIVSSRDGNCPDFRGAVDLRVCKSFVLPLRLPLRDRGPGFRRGTAGGMLALARCDRWKNSRTRAARQMRRAAPSPAEGRGGGITSTCRLVSSSSSKGCGGGFPGRTTRRREDETTRNRASFAKGHGGAITSSCRLVSPSSLKGRGYVPRGLARRVACAVAGSSGQTCRG